MLLQWNSTLQTPARYKQFCLSHLKFICLTLTSLIQYRQSRHFSVTWVTRVTQVIHFRTFLIVILFRKELSCKESKLWTTFSLNLYFSLPFLWTWSSHSKHWILSQYKPECTQGCAYNNLLPCPWVSTTRCYLDITWWDCTENRKHYFTHNTPKKWLWKLHMQCWGTERNWPWSSSCLHQPSRRRTK